MFKKPQDVVKALCIKGFSEQWIADKANISQGSVHKIKKGSIRHPRIDTAQKLETLYLQVMGIG